MHLHLEIFVFVFDLNTHLDLCFLLYKHLSTGSWIPRCIPRHINSRYQLNARCKAAQKRSRYYYLLVFSVDQDCILYCHCLAISQLLLRDHRCYTGSRTLVYVHLSIKTLRQCEISVVALPQLLNTFYGKM